MHRENRSKAAFLIVIVILIAICAGVAGANFHGVAQKLFRSDIQAVQRSTGQQEQLGMQVYRTHCAQCHGADAQGAPDVAPPLVDGPLLAAYMTSDRINHALRYGVLRGGEVRMAPIPGISDAQVFALTRYLRRLTVQR